jgi:hypothetical protein
MFLTTAFQNLGDIAIFSWDLDPVFLSKVGSGFRQNLAPDLQ